MPLKISVRKESEAPRPTSSGKPNEDVQALKAKMSQLPTGSVLEVQVDRGRSIRGVKTLITRASKERGSKWKHWHSGNKVYAQPRGRGGEGRGEHPRGRPRVAADER